MSDESSELKKIGTVGIDENGKSVHKEPIFVSISEYKKVKYLDIRKYYEDNDQWRPTKKGITVNSEQFSDLMNLLKDKENEIKEFLNK